MLGFLSMPAAVGSLRVADAVGIALDRGLIDDGLYFRVSNTFWTNVHVRFSSSELSAGYTFRLVPDPLSLRIAPYHIGDVRYTYSTPRFSLSLSETLGIGEQVFLGTGRANPLAGVMPTSDPRLPASGAPALAAPNTLDSTLLPAAATLPIVLQRADAGISYRWDRRWSSSLSLGYSLYGGLTRAAQDELALLHAMNASALLAHRLNTRTDLSTGLQLARGWDSRDSGYALLVLSETWQHQLTKRTKVEAGGGISVREEEQPNGPTTLATVPVGALGVAHTMRARDLTGYVRFGVTFTPLVDAVTATLQNRFTATLVSMLNYDDLYAGTSFSLSQSVPTNGPHSARFIGAGLFSGYRFTPWLGASLSAQVTRQWIGLPGNGRADYVASGLTWGVYGGLDAMLAVKRF